MSLVWNRLSYWAATAIDATNEQSVTTVCCIEKQETAIIIVGFSRYSDGLTHLFNEDFCFSDKANKPSLSLKCENDFFEILSTAHEKGIVYEKRSL